MENFECPSELQNVTLEELLKHHDVHVRSYAIRICTRLGLDDFSMYVYREQEKRREQKPDTGERRRAADHCNLILEIVK